MIVILNCQYCQVFKCQAHIAMIWLLLLICAPICFRQEMSNMLKINVNYPPPNIPGGYGSRQYPLNCDYASSSLTKVPLELHMRDISRARRANEIRKMAEQKAEGADEIRRRAEKTAERDRNRYCETCSETISEAKPLLCATYHKHFSSKLQRMKMPLDELGQYLCITCETKPHHYKASDRVSIYITGSTMAHWRGRWPHQKYKGDPLHIDHLECPGATVRELHHAFISEYDGFWRPVDVMLIAGLNNVLRGQPAQAIIDEMKKFKTYVENMGRDKDGMMGEKSSFAICTLLFPPKLVHMEKDPHRLDCLQFTDKSKCIEKVNAAIMRMNNEGTEAHYTRRVPQMHTWGLEKRGKAWGRGFCVGKLNRHRMSDWREEEFEKKLHLSDTTKLRAGKMIVDYFQYIYGMRHSQFNTRKEVEEAARRIKKYREQEKKEIEKAKHNPLLDDDNAETAADWAAHLESASKGRKMAGDTDMVVAGAVGDSKDDSDIEIVFEKVQGRVINQEESSADQGTIKGHEKAGRCTQFKPQPGDTGDRIKKRRDMKDKERRLVKEVKKARKRSWSKVEQKGKRA